MKGMSEVFKQRWNALRKNLVSSPGFAAGLSALWFETRFRWAAWALAVILLTFPPSTLSQQGPVRILTLKDALEIAAEKNRDILKAREFRNQVLGKYREERAAALPQLSLTASATSSFDNTFGALFGGEFSIPSRQNVRVAEVGVTQALYTWGQVGAAIRAAKSGFALAEDEVRLYRQAAARDVSSEFYNILLAKELHGLAVENQRQKERHLVEAQRKYAVGLATDYDVLAGEVALKNAQPEVIRSENLVRTARERLRFLLALDHEEVDAQGSLLASVDPYPQFEQAAALAWENRPEVSDLLHRLGISRELVKVAVAGDKPRLDFSGRAGLRSFSVGPFTASGQTWTAAFTMSFPVFDGFRARGRVQQAATEMTRLQIDQAKLKDSIALEVRDAVNAVREAGEIVKALQGTVSQAEKLLWMAEQGYELGVKTRLDVEDAQLNVVQAKGNLARAQRDYHVARMTLEWAKGTIQ